MATRLFSERGYEAVGVDEIGTEAGVTGPAVYRYFQGKDEILATLFDQAIDGALRATSGRFDTPAEELDYRVRAHAQHVLREHKLAIIWIREGRSLSTAHRQRLNRRERQYLELWVECLEQCYPILTEHEARDAAAMALGTLNAVALWPSGALPSERMDTDLADFVLAGLQSLYAKPRLARAP